MLKPVAGLKKPMPQKPKSKPAPAPQPVSEKPTVPEKAGPAISPLAPKTLAKLPPLSGVRLAAGEAGIRYQNRTDLLLAVMAPGTQVGGVFTTSKTASAPVDWCRSALAQKSARMLVVNSGNANAFTGKAGVDVVRQTAESAAALAGCKPQEVFIASTGVIGEPLPVQRITKALPEIYENTGAGAWNDAARAIMTTDTFPKMATASAQIDGARVTINGIAKGSGMIAPDMATMLSFIFTDAKIPSEVLQQLASQGAQDSFNATTVDSDTSTSDTMLLFATGKGALHDPVLRSNDKRLDDFRIKLYALMKDLAVQVVRDGEGAQHLVRINVNGAESQQSAKKIALAIANSPLVKTAIAGNDANWGRIVMAIGKSGEPANRDKLSIRIGNHKVATNGQRDPAYSEPFLAKYMQRQEVDIDVDVGVGKFSSGVWTCDLTHGYIAINGDYRS